MSRGSATESLAGHLVSRHGPRTSLPFFQDTGPQVLGSSLHRSISKKGGSRAGTQGFPLEQHTLPAGKASHILQLSGSWEQKWLVGGSSLLYGEQHLGQLPTCSCGEERVNSRSSLIQQLGRALGRPLQLRTPGGPLLLAVLGASVPQALGRGRLGLWRPRPDACGIMHMRTHCHSPRKEVSVPSLGQGMD